MACPTLIFADQFLHYPPDQIGQLGQSFGKLFTEGIPLAPMALIPRETFLRVVRDNHLSDLIESSHTWYNPGDTNSKHKLKNQLVDRIRSQPVPDWFAHELVKLYHNDLQGAYITLLPADKQHHGLEKDFRHIKGEANFIESVLEFWARLVGEQVNSDEHPHLSWLAPAPILIQAQFQPLVSGTAHTSNPHQGAKNQILITAIWGAPDRTLLEEQADSFGVDVRTWQVVHRELATKTKQYLRDSDSQVMEPVPSRYHTHATLTDEQAIAIAQVIFAIKQKRLNQQVVSWELTREGLFVTAVHELVEHHHAAQTVVKKTLTKLYISTGNPQKHAPHLASYVDGVGVLRSEYTYAKVGFHPLHLIKSQQKHLLRKELVETVKNYQTALPFKPILFRSQNFNSSELRHLKYSENYEPHESNPYLGYRGGIQLVRQPEVLHFELDVLREILENSRAPLGYMLPFVRGASELEQIMLEIEESGLFKQPHFSVWMQINTPENIINLRSYPTQRLAGLSVNARSLHALSLGIDPDNPEIYEHYVSETVGLGRLLEQLAATVADLRDLREFSPPLHLHLHLEDFSHELVAQAVKLGYHGVVVKPAVVQIAHSAIVETESARLARL